MPENHSSIAGGTDRSIILPVIRISHLSSVRANMVAAIPFDALKRAELTAQSTSHPFAKTTDVILT